jgi:GTP cyclohydrolase I
MGYSNTKYSYSLIPLFEESNYMSDKLAGHYSDIISILGEDTSRGGLVDTPKRAAKAMQFLS